MNPQTGTLRGARRASCFRPKWVLTAIVFAVLALFMSRFGRPLESLMQRAPLSAHDALNTVDGHLLRPLLRPRVPGTPGAAEAQKHIVAQLESYGWVVDKLPFTAKTPHGDVPMANIVSRRNGRGTTPELTLAAHFDSKKNPAGFVGAIDSAFPCALLLWLASLPNPKRDFDLVFFDGEEAFEEWTDSDSLYGARTLAAHQHSLQKLPQTLVLLDLIGHKSDPIPSWFPATKQLHAELAQIDAHLVGGRDLHEYAGMMLDDHIPFLEHGVDVLHLIPPMFPPQWHTLDDNEDLLDWPTMEAWAVMLEKWLY